MRGLGIDEEGRYYELAHLRVEVEPLERVDRVGELGEVVGVEALDAGEHVRSLDHGLEVGVVEALKRAKKKCTVM